MYFKGFFFAVPGTSDETVVEKATVDLLEAEIILKFFFKKILWIYGFWRRIGNFGLELFSSLLEL